MGTEFVGAICGQKNTQGILRLQHSYGSSLTAFARKKCRAYSKRIARREYEDTYCADGRYPSDHFPVTATVLIGSD